MAGLTFDRVNLLGIGFSVFILILVFLLVKERMIREKYALVWFLFGLFILTMSLFQGLMDRFSNLIGVDYAPSAFFAILISCAYLLLLSMSVSISGLKTQNKVLSQELGIAKLRLEELEKKINKAEL